MHSHARMPEASRENQSQTGRKRGNQKGPGDYTFTKSNNIALLWKCEKPSPAVGFWLVLLAFLCAFLTGFRVVLARAPRGVRVAALATMLVIVLSVVVASVESGAV
jgi:hypothetical protein